MISNKNATASSSILLIGISIVIMIMSVLPEGAVNLPITEIGWNIAHIPAYALLTAAAIFKLSKHYGTNYKTIWIGSLLVSIYGIFIELIQPLTGRQMSFNDILLNELGIFLVAIIASTIVKERKKHDLFGRR